MKDAIATMGAILPDDAGGRDAVHVAVFSALSKEKLARGDYVGIVDQDGGDYVVAIDTNKVVGIVDPFLGKQVNPGERFWVYLFPRTITGLSHQWTHPAFEEIKQNNIYVTPATKLAAEKSIKYFCEKSDVDYDSFMIVANQIADGVTNGTYYPYMGDADSGYGWNGRYITVFGSDASGEITREIWGYVETVLGKKIKNGPSYFSCSC